MKEGKIPVIYLVGAGHSGSTLLDLIMGSHSQIFGIGEFQQYFFKPGSSKSCMCGKTVVDCPFWKKVFKNLNLESGLTVLRKKKDFLLNRKSYLDNYYRRPVNFKKYIELNEELYKNILKYSGKKIVFDSSKWPDRAELLLNSKKLDITILHLVRNGKGVTWSWRNRHLNPDEKGNVWSCQNKWDKYPNFIRGVRVMYHWLKRNLYIEILKKRNRINYIFLRYEDFVKNPKGTLSFILEKVGLSFEAQMMNSINKENHQVAGNLRLKRKLAANQEIKIEEDICWKKDMPLVYRITFDLLFGWLNLIYKNKKSK